MKIGIFDSGLGGLHIMRAITRALPGYDYMYLGDTQRVPYGNRSHGVIEKFTWQGVRRLLQENCALVVVACNTASAQALRRIQQYYLPRYFPDRRVLGVIVPTVETIAEHHFSRIGIIGTVSTITSGSYLREIRHRIPKTTIFQNAAPLLVSVIEAGDYQLVQPLLREYVRPLLLHRVECIVLGCTHYPIVQRQIKTIVGKGVKIISQDQIIGPKLKMYLRRHPEIHRRLRKGRRRIFLATDITPQLTKLAQQWFGTKIRLYPVTIDT